MWFRSSPSAIGLRARVRSDLFSSNFEILNFQFIVIHTYTPYFSTAPGPVDFFAVKRRNANMIVVEWMPPVDPNGEILGYDFAHRESENRKRLLWDILIFVLNQDYVSISKIFRSSKLEFFRISKFCPFRIIQILNFRRCNLRILICSPWFKPWGPYVGRVCNKRVTNSPQCERPPSRTTLSALHIRTYNCRQGRGKLPRCVHNLSRR